MKKVLFFLIIFSFGIITVNGAEIVTGISGNCSWEIDENGNLTVFPTEGDSCTLANTSATSNTSGPWYTNRNSIKTVKFYNKVYANEIARAMFYEFTEMTSIDFTNFDTSNTVDMSYMFYSNHKLVDLNLSDFDTKNVTNMAAMFYGLFEVKSLDLSNFNTSKVTSFSSMFSQMYNVESINVTSFDTSNATNFNGMFLYCFKLSEIDLSSFDTNNSIDSMNMFFDEYNKTLSKIKIGSGFNYKLTERPTGIFSRGTWLREEDGKTYSAVEIARRTEQDGGFPGTFIKMSNVSKEMIPNFKVDYKILRFDKINSIESNDPDRYQIVGDRILLVKNIPIEENDDYEVDSYVIVKFVDQVEDRFGNKYDMEIKIDSVHIYGLIEKEDINNLHFELLRCDGSIKLESYFYNNPETALLGLDSRIVNGNKTTFSMNFDIRILDKQGNPVEGSYIYSLSDIDNYSSAGEEWSEAIVFDKGIDSDTIITSNPTLLKVSKEKIYNSVNDNSSELTEFLAKADASRTKFTLIGNAAGCDRMMFEYYQPKEVSMILHDDEGNIIEGGKLALYYGDELIEEWDNDGSVNKFFLNPGEYSLRESVIPEGYAGADEIKFYVGVGDAVIVADKNVSQVILVDRKTSVLLDQLNPKTKTSISLITLYFLILSGFVFWISLYRTKKIKNK